MPDSAIVPPRSEVPLESTWNATSVFASTAAWEKEFEAIANSLGELDQFRGHLTEGPALLADAIQSIERLIERAGKVYFYAVMSHNVDSTDAEATSLNSRASGLFGRVSAAVSFINPELIAIGEATVRQWLSQEPRLTVYQHFVDNLFRLQTHVRSAEVESLLGSLMEPFAGARNTRGMLTGTDMVFRPAVGSAGGTFAVAQSSILSLMQNPDRAVARSSYESETDGYLAVKTTLATTLETSVKQDIFNARARNYDSSLDAALFKENIPTSVFHNLIDTFKRNLPIWHRYWAVRRRILGYESLHPYDIWTPLDKGGIDIPFRQAVDWICEALAPLGQDYVDVMRRGCLEERWVDHAPNIGKRDGAFSFGWKGTHPFIMTSYAANVQSMSILAHELGHSMHSYLTWQNQPMTYSDYSLFVAEVASNFHQAMLRAYLLEHQPDPAFQWALIDETMFNFHRYFFIMPTLARFELEVHERVERGQAVTADDMNTLMADLFEEGYGGHMVVDRARVGITWATFGHLFEGYYVFQYATGISGANDLASKVLTGDKSAADNYRSFLKAGSSMYPLDALRMAGTDLTTPEPVERTFAILDSMVTRLENISA